MNASVKSVLLRRRCMTSEALNIRRCNAFRGIFFYLLLEYYKYYGKRYAFCFITLRTFSRAPPARFFRHIQTQTPPRGKRSRSGIYPLRIASRAAPAQRTSGDRCRCSAGHSRHEAGVSPLSALREVAVFGAEYLVWRRHTSGNRSPRRSVAHLWDRLLAPLCTNAILGLMRSYNEFKGCVLVDISLILV